jgi:hypothetical protein
MTVTGEIQLKPDEPPQLSTGSWRLVPADSFVSFTARLPWRRVRGRLPLIGQVLITEPVEDSRALLTARTSAVSGCQLAGGLSAGSGSRTASMNWPASSECSSATLGRMVRPGPSSPADGRSTQRGSPASGFRHLTVASR